MSLSIAYTRYPYFVRAIYFTLRITMCCLRENWWYSRAIKTWSRLTLTEVNSYSVRYDIRLLMMWKYFFLNKVVFNLCTICFSFFLKFENIESTFKIEINWFWILLIWRADSDDHDLIFNDMKIDSTYYQRSDYIMIYVPKIDDQDILIVITSSKYVHV